VGVLAFPTCEGSDRALGHAGAALGHLGVALPRASDAEERTEKLIPFTPHLPIPLPTDYHVEVERGDGKCERGNGPAVLVDEIPEVHRVSHHPRSDPMEPECQSQHHVYAAFRSPGWWCSTPTSVPALVG